MVSEICYVSIISDFVTNFYNSVLLFLLAFLFRLLKHCHEQVFVCVIVVSVLQVQQKYLVETLVDASVFLRMYRDLCF